MAALTFGSVGDIIALCEIVANVVEALSESRGSSAQYQELITELFSLSQALESVDELALVHHAIQNAGRLRNALGLCHKCLDVNLRTIQKYQRSLRAGGSGKSVTDVFRKLRWQSHQDDVLKFRREISLHVNAVNIILHVFSTNVLREDMANVDEHVADLERSLGQRLDELDRRSQEQHTKTQDLVQSEHTKSRVEAQLAKLETFSKLDSQHHVLLQIQASSTQHEDRFSKMLGTVERNTGARMDDNINQLASRLETLILSQYLPNELHKTWTQAPLTIRDIAGSFFPVHPEFIRSYSVLCTILRDRSRNDSLTSTGEFALEDECGNHISSDSEWRAAARSGSQVYVRPYFFIDLDEKEQTSCYLCGESTLRSSGLATICFDCQRTYETPTLIQRESRVLRIRVLGRADSYIFEFDQRMLVSEEAFKLLTSDHRKAVEISKHVVYSWPQAHVRNYMLNKAPS